MKVILNSWKGSALCFFLMPVLMGFLVILVKAGLVDAQTVLPDLLVYVLDRRLSAKVFIWTLIFAVTVGALVTIYLENHELAHEDAELAARLYDFVGGLLGKTFYFWSGVLVAWSFGTRYISFLEAIPSQEIVAVMTFGIGVGAQLVLSKYRHFMMKGIDKTTFESLT